MQIDVFIGSIEFFAFGVVPEGWAQCDGQLLPIDRNQALFSLLGIKFGGDGIRTFGLPDLRGRLLAGPGSGIAIGSPGGEETHQLLPSEMPSHTHDLMANASTPGSSNTFTPAANTVLGNSSDVTTNAAVNVYAQGAPNGTMMGQTVSSSGAGAAHENRMPFVAFNACIALVGIFPPRQ